MVEITSNNLVEIVKEGIGQVYTDTRWIGSLQDFLEEVERRPYEASRTAAQYIHDAILSYGTSVTWDKFEPYMVFNVFKDVFKNGKDRIFGHDRVLWQLVTQLKAGALEEGEDRIQLIDGPTGSCKTPMLDLISRGVEYYSRTLEGRKFTFSWVFPNDWRPTKRDMHLGFVKPEDARLPESYARLKRRDIALEISCLFRETPLHLLPRIIPSGGRNVHLREEFLASAMERAGANRPVPRKLVEADLCGNCQQVRDYLLDIYDGDWASVMRHVKTFSYRMSERGGRGIASVETDPIEMVVRAENWNWKEPRISSLLPDCELIYYSGKIVAAHGGILHIHDGFTNRTARDLGSLLRIVQDNKTSGGRVTLDTDMVVFLTSNEEELERERANPENRKFWDRIQRVRVPYLVNASREEGIYERDVRNTEKRIHVAPYTTAVFAWWSVLCRLERPKGAKHADYQELNEEQRDLLGSLSPWQKLLLYSCRSEEEDAQIRDLSEHHELKETYTAAMQELGEEASDQAWRDAFDLACLIPKSELPRSKEPSPDTFTQKQLDLIDYQFMKALRKDIPYEGFEGPSPRIIQNIIAEVTSKHDAKCLDPFKVLSELEKIIAEKYRTLGRVIEVEESDEGRVLRVQTGDKKRTVKAVKIEDPEYAFLIRNKETDGYYAFEKFVDLCRFQYYRNIRQHVLDAMSGTSFEEVDKKIRRYVEHVVAQRNRQKVYDPELGKDVQPNESLMRSVEDRLSVKKEDAHDFRERHIEHTITRLARAGALESKRTVDLPGYDKPQLDYTKIFPEIYAAHRAQKVEISTSKEDLQAHFQSYGTPHFQRVPPKERELVERTYERLKEQDIGGRHYCDKCAKNTLLYAISHMLEEDLIEIKDKKII